MRRARALQTALASKARLMIRFTQSASLALPNAKNVNQPWITAMSAKRIVIKLEFPIKQANPTHPYPSFESDSLKNFRFCWGGWRLGTSPPACQCMDGYYETEA